MSTLRDLFWLGRDAACEWKLRRRRRPVDASMLVVPIRRADGSEVTELESPGHWYDLILGYRAERALYVDDLLRERHHRVYGQSWLAGRRRVEFLLEQGVSPAHRVLDVGCGSGRVGVWLIAHLAANGYVGVDAHLHSLVAFSAYELRLHALGAKQPRLVFDSGFEFDRLGARFDVVLDLSVTRHLSAERARVAYARIAQVLAPGGRVFASGLGRERVAQLEELGFARALHREVPHDLAIDDPRRSRVTAWDVFERRR